MSITPPTPHLSTERLRLEPLRIFHAAEMVQMMDGRGLTYEQLSRQYTLEFAGSRHESEQWHNWILRRRDTEQVIGRVRVTITGLSATTSCRDIGADGRRNDYDTEALQAISHWLESHGVPLA